MAGTEREQRIAQVLRPLGTAPMTRAQAVLAGRLLGIHWTSVYRLRKRFLADPVLSSLRPKRPGRATGSRHLEPKQEAIVDDVLTQWLPRQRELPHPRLSVHIEVRRRCG